MSGPAAGWYPDPGGSDGYRYWDGSGWTQALQPSPPATAPQHTWSPSVSSGPQPDAGQAAMGAFPGDPSLTASSRARRRSRPWVVAGVAVLVLGVGAIAVLATVFQRGAATPIAAAEQLVDAVNADDWLGVFRVLPPDEVDAFRGLVDYLPEGQGGDDLTAGIRVEVVFGPSTQLVDGVASIPIERFTLEAQEPGPAADALDLAVGERITEDLRGEPDAAVVAVERGGSWFVSPVGTILELASRESGLGGAGPAIPRSGAASAQAAVEGAIRSFGEEDAAAFLDLIDPEEFQILDHYRSLLSTERRRWDGSVRLSADVQGEIVEVQRIDVDEGGYWVSIDLTTMCLEEPGYRECLRDELDAMSDDGAPWTLPAMRSLLEPEPAAVRIATVTRNGRSYISLESTLSESVLPVLDRLGPHNRAGVVRPDLSPNAVEVAGSPGEIVDVVLHDNWNAVRFPEGADLRACPPDSGPSSEWRVDGARVESERIGDPFGWQEGDVPGVVVGVSAGQDIDRVQVRLVPGDERC